MSKTLTASEMCPMDLGINILSGKILVAGYK